MCPRVLTHKGTHNNGCFRPKAVLPVEGRTAISQSAPQITHQNHYVPIWYQKSFIVDPSNSLQLLDLDPPRIALPDGRSKLLRSVHLNRAPASCFVAEDL